MEFSLFLRSFELNLSNDREWIMQRKPLDEAQISK